MYLKLIFFDIDIPRYLNLALLFRVSELYELTKNNLGYFCDSLVFSINKVSEIMPGTVNIYIL